MEEKDLVDRLFAAGKSAYDPHHVLMQEAAEEIDRLRSKIMILEEQLSELLQEQVLALDKSQ